MEVIGNLRRPVSCVLKAKSFGMVEENSEWKGTGNNVYKFIKILIYLFERQTKISHLLVHSQMFPTARAGLQWSLEPGTQFMLSMWMKGPKYINHHLLPQSEHDYVAGITSRGRTWTQVFWYGMQAFQAVS